MNKIFSALLMLSLINSPAFSLPYDYTSTKSLPIRMYITEEISTKDSIYEGNIIKFRVIDDVYSDGNIVVQKGSIINAKIETIITSGMNGFPAEIIVDDFEFPNISNTKLISTYSKQGQNRCLWVYPLKWSLTLIPFVGSLTNLIKGGHARIKQTDIVTVYYYPDWK